MQIETATRYPDRVSASQRLGGHKTPGCSRETSISRSFSEVRLSSLLLLAVGWQLGILNDESPDWTWISAVLLIDVAHVWSTSLSRLFRYRGIQAAVLALSAGAGFWLRGRRGVVFRRRADVLAGARDRRGVSFCPAAVRLGCAVSAEARRNRNVDVVDRCRGDLSRDDLSAGILDDVAAAKFSMVCCERFFRSLPAFVETVLFPIYVLALTAYFAKVDLSIFHERLSESSAKISSSRRLPFAGMSASSPSIPITRSRYERDHPRRAVFCADLVLCASETRSDRAGLSYVFAELDRLSCDSLGACVC